MTRARYEELMDEIGVGVEYRDMIWERVLGKAPSERRVCAFSSCGKTFFPHRKDQRFCPGGLCSNSYHQQQYRDRYIS